MRHPDAKRRTDIPPSVYVIGGGPAGLSAAAALKRRGVSAHILEQGCEIGGGWDRHYDRLRLRTLRRHSGLPGLRLPERFGRYVHRSDVASYLKSYSRHHDLTMTLGVRVERIERISPTDGEDARWKVTASDGRSFTADAVVVASGSNSTPSTPSWPGRDSFSGTMLHSSQYQNAAPFRGKDVLVVGAGNAGSEIATDLSEVQGIGAVRLSYRSAPLVVPPNLGPVPFAMIALLLSRLPAAWADRAMVLMSRLTVPDLQRQGLSRPDRKPPAGTHRVPVQDVGLLAAIRTGRVEPVPAVTGFTAEGVQLADGRTIRADVVISATGFVPDLEKLIDGVHTVDERGLPSSSFDRHAVGLHFLGFTAPLGGTLRQIAIDARKIARNESRRAGRTRRSTPSWRDREQGEFVAIPLALLARGARARL